MADDTQTTFTLTTKTGDLQFFATKDGSSNYTAQSTPRVRGAQVDDVNPLPVSSAPVGGNSSTIAQAFRILKAAPGTLYSVHFNATQSGYLMLFDLVAKPNDGAVSPRRAWFFSSASQQTIDRVFDPPLAMANGAVLVFSTGADSFTLVTAGAVGFFSAEMT